jgi:Zyg-11 family protein
VHQFCFFTVAVNTGSGSDQEYAQHQSQPASCASLLSAVPGSRLVFKDSEVYFHSDLSEKLLTALSEKGKLSDLTMTLFDSNTTRLR